MCKVTPDNLGRFARTAQLLDDLSPLLSPPTRLRGSLCASVTSRLRTDVRNIKARTDAPPPTRTQVPFAFHSRSDTRSMMSPRFSLLVIAAGLTNGALCACG